MEDMIRRIDAVEVVYEALRMPRVDYRKDPFHDSMSLAFAMVEEISPIIDTEGKWIPVTEKLPEDETDVLVCSDEGNIEVCRGSMSTEFPGEFIWYTSGWRFGDVIAWMPLPEPYVK